MQTRREFLKTAALLSGAVGLWGALDGPILKALAIEPEPGSSYLDAEHIVILMQENRSFDHCYGTLQGVRGYNDPRAITLPNGNPVWVQTNAAGKSYAPFRLNLKDTKATWMGFLPHNWASQVDARNGGKHNGWLEAKKSGRKQYASMPLTLGHYNRDDIPFYYALADAFTICDQHFCSSLTPTLPNRLYFWTGTVRERPTVDSPANVRNEQVINNNWEMGWTTFPERLEERGISWKIYQNELDVPSGLDDEEDAWLGNFGCNITEYFPQYHAAAHPLHRAYLEKMRPVLPDRIAALKKQIAAKGLTEEQTAKLKKELDNYQSDAAYLAQEWPHWDENVFERLSPQAKALYEKAFCVNTADPAYRTLIEMTYRDGNIERKVQVPQGDVFHQFREDVKAGKLPTVTWLVAPERLSDHPESAWYGAWYISEALRILTENPDIWKKTIFILTYDENDGYFDHVPPFVAPHPRKPETGIISKELDATLEYVELEQDSKLKLKGPRESPIGLGYRVPMVIASPWSRGGCVCSQVFDNTSILQFLEKFLAHKSGQPISETNISSWRRAICGDLTSAFQSSSEEKEATPEFLSRDLYVRQIYESQFKPLPSGFMALSKQEIQQIREDPRSSPWMPSQEPGVRRSCALPYELYVDGWLIQDRSRFFIRLEASKDRFAEQAVGCPFTVYARMGNDVMVRNYAVAAGDHLEDSWAIADFADGLYHFQVCGPNGFYREFTGSDDDPSLEIHIGYSQISAADRALNGNVEVRVVNHDPRRDFLIQITDRSYKTPTQRRSIAAGGSAMLVIDTQRSFRWYDFDLRIDAVQKFQRRFAGRVETGKWSISDPAMGGVVG
jgi:phospholipase C